MPKIIGALSTAAAAIVLVLAFTAAGHRIDAATQHFMLFYAGVFALLGLTASVLLGLIATDRIMMTPGHRVMAQAMHRAVSFGALAFLIIHIVTEIVAQRVHVIDAVIPFLSPFRTFYIGLGTIASDLLILIVVTSIIRKRFTAHGKAWRWRAIHYCAYVAFAFGVLHGLLGGRSAKPYVDWSYGFAIALTALGLAVRFLAASLRPKEAISAAPSMDRPGGPAASPMRAAALSMAQAQLGGTVQVLPAWSAPSAIGPFSAVPRPTPTNSGPMPAIGGPPAAIPSGAIPPAAAPSGAAPKGRHATGPRPALPRPGPGPGPGPAVPGRAAKQPQYEPGYDGPPRFVGAPRRDVPPDTHPYGPVPRRGTGPMPRVTGTGPIPRTGPVPARGTDPPPGPGTGGRGRRGTGRPARGVGPADRRRREGPGPSRGDEGI
jgi:DMSO/TMAO reductase YedYZ heme-binding membrane subunit